MAKTSLGARKLKSKLSPPMTKKELARRLEVTTQAISNWLGGRAKPARETAFKIEKILGVPAESWVDTA